MYSQYDYLLLYKKINEEVGDKIYMKKSGIYQLDKIAIKKIY